MRMVCAVAIVVGWIGVGATPGYGQDLRWTRGAANPGDGFGSSVDGGADVDGDGIADIVVGASGSDASRVYVLSADDGETLLTWDSPYGGGDLFGDVLALVGDVDGDGRADVLVGTHETDDFRGRAYVFTARSTEPLYAWDGERRLGFFGYDVAGAGDVDGDGRADLLVGAFDETNPAGFDTGKAHVYSGATGEEIYALHPETTLNPNFGIDVASAGDVDGDGFDDFFVGARDEADLGRAYLFSGRTGEPLHIWEGERGSDLGSDMAVVGDVDGDSVPDIAIGASSHLRETGRVYLYSGPTDELLLQWEGEQGDSAFGSDLAGVGDTDGDGLPDLLVAAVRHNGPAGNEAGKVYLLSGDDGSILSAWDGRSQFEFFGAMGPAGDIDGDGLADFILGSPRATTTRGTTGYTFVVSGVDYPLTLAGSDVAPGQQATFEVSGGEPGEQVRWVASPIGTGFGRCLPSLGGSCINLEPPWIDLGDAVVAADGTAILQTEIPADLQARRLSVQAVILRPDGAARSNSATFFFDDER